MDDDENEKPIPSKLWLKFMKNLKTKANFKPIQWRKEKGRGQ